MNAAIDGSPEPALRFVQRGCLHGAPSLEVAAGCPVGCSFCHLRGYDEGPIDRGVEPREDLVDRLLAELDDPESTDPRPEHVLVHPDADALPSDPLVQDLVYKSARALLDRKIGVSFVTKGALTRRFLELAAANRGRLCGRVSFLTLDPAISARFEPGAASPEDRLDTAEALRELDALAGVRIDPLLPGLTDGDEAFAALVAALRERGIDRVWVSYVHLRPGILGQLSAVLPEPDRAALARAYRDQPWTEIGTATKAKILPRAWREEGHRRLRRIGDREGVEVRVCQCKNPDLSGDSCGAAEARRFPSEARGPAHTPGERPLVAC